MKSLVAIPIAFVALLTLLFVVSENPASLEASGHPIVEIQITDGGFIPDSPTVPPGASIQWTNLTGAIQAIFTDDGRIDSGSLGPGAGFTVALDSPGAYRYQSTSGATGDLLVGEPALTGAATDLVAAHIVDIPYPQMRSADISPYPGTGMELHRSWIEVGFVAGTTVAEANDALAGAGVPIAGAIGRFEMLLVVAPDRADFSGFDAAFDALRTHPAVEFAAPVTLGEVDAVPAPATESIRVERDLGWEDLASEPDGRGGNWQLEVSRVPEAWNVLDTIRNRGVGIDTIVLDGDFSVHEDLPFTAGLLCKTAADGTPACTAHSSRGDHANNVSGIIGAKFDNRASANADRSVGVSGVNPVAQISGYEVLGGSLPASQQWDRLFEIFDTGLANPRVINRSLANPMKRAEAQAQIARGPVCGPGSNDDDAVDGEWCTPSTLDSSRQLLEQGGRWFLRVAARELSNRDILLMSAAGNMGTFFCPPSQPCIVEPAQWGSYANWAAANWAIAESGPNPIIVVEALGATVAIEGGTAVDPARTRAPFSQIAGDISAPGIILSPCQGPDQYCYQGGTSQATPMVAGLVSYLLAFDPTLTIDDIRQVLADSAVADTSDPTGTPASQPAPRIDAFGALLRLDGAARALADLNDRSKDGNRRVVPVPEGEQPVLFDYTMSNSSGRHSEPDGAVNLRDFRRFRDAWLQLCGDSVRDECEPAYLAGLAAPGQASSGEGILDGGANHPKLDLNHDDCVKAQATCPPEGTHSRFDLNGDGQVSIVAAASLPLGPDGAPGGPTEMTDLDVMRAVWNGGAGWTASDLDTLMTSADLTVDIQNAVELGALAGTVEILDGVTPVTSRDLSFAPSQADRDDVTLVTVPSGSDFTAEIDLIFPDRTETITLPVSAMTPGEDRRLEVCRVDVELDPPVMPPDGASTATVTSRVVDCLGTGFGGATTTFTIEPTTPNPPSLDPASATADAAGVATTTVTAGLDRANYFVTASIAVPGPGGLVLDGLAGLEVNAYDGERIASSGETSGYSRVMGWEQRFIESRQQYELYGPSINDAGHVAFQALDRDKVEAHDDPPPTVGGNSARPDVYVADGTGDPLDPATAANLTELFMVDERFVAGPVVIGNDGDVAARLSEWEQNWWGPEEWIWLLDGGRINPPVEMAYADSSDGTTPLMDFGVPDRASDQRAAFAVEHRDDFVLGELTKTRVAVSQQLSNDPALPFASLDVSSQPVSLFFPEVFMADDGTTVARITGAGTAAPTEDRIVVGPAPVHFYQSLAGASTEGWASVGAPGIADTGQAVAFTGDRGAGEALWLSVRALDGSFSLPIPIEGQDTANVGGGPIGGSELATFDMDQPVGVLHEELGAVGLVDDLVTLVFMATPDGTDPQLPAQPALWSTTLRLLTDAGDATTPVLVDSPPLRLVKQVGTASSGGTVARLVIWDPVAANPGNPGGHRIAYGMQLTDGVQHIVRATWTGAAPAAGANQPNVAGLENAALKFSSTASSGLDAVAGDPFPPAGDPAAPTSVPAFPQFSISDVTPSAGDEIVIVNRSRDPLGTAIAATLDLGSGAIPMAPGESHRVVASEGPLSILMQAGTATPVQWDIVITPVINDAPIADAGGPYTIDSGQRVVFDATGSSDPDGDTLTFAWDLDGDLQFDDGTQGLLPVEWPDVQSLICGGSCDAGPYVVSLQVADDRGATDTSTATVAITVIAADFAVDIAPLSQPITAGGRSEFLVKVESIGGFVEPVSLTVGPLPTDWSAQLESSVIVPSGVTTLTVTAAADAGQGDAVAIEVTGTGGGLTHSTGTTSDVVIGLIPLCETASYAGTLLDAYTGAPVAGANIELRTTAPGLVRFWYAVSDADGNFLITGLPGAGTVLRSTISLAGYYTEVRLHEFACDSETNGDIDLVPVLSTTLEGRMVEAVRNADGSITATNIPVVGGQAGAATSLGGYATTDAEGYYSLDTVPLNFHNEPRLLSISGFADEFWGQSIRRGFSLGTTTRIDFALVRKCSSVVQPNGTVVDQDGLPVEGAFVRLNPFGTSQTTAADGSFSFGATDYTLNFNNSPRDLTIQTFPLAGWPTDSTGDFITVVVDECDRVYDDPVRLEVFRAPEPIDYTADIQGVVRDKETGVPVEGALVRFTYNYSATTDASGAYLLENVLIRRTPDPGPFTRNVQLNVQHDNYWDGFSAMQEVTSGTTATIDVVMVEERSGTMEGFVRDIATGEPVENALVYHSSGYPSQRAFSDAEGHYLLEGVPLGYENGSRAYAVRAQRSATDTQSAYYQASVQTVFADRVITEQDWLLTEICQGGSIGGVVVNAVDGTPIEGARVSVNVSGVNRPLTDIDGRFLIENITPGVLNAPRTVHVTAQKIGFISATKTVTVFCDANIYVSFGEQPGGFGTIVGTVTDDSGTPIPDAFIGSSFGGSTTTDAAGDYELSDVPLTPEGGAQDWTVTAVNAYDSQSAAVTVGPDVAVRQDFIFVLPVPNDPPVAVDDGYDTTQGIPLTVVSPGVLLNDSDPDGDAVVVESHTQPAGGTVAVATDGSFVYTPDAATTGAESFNYTIGDGNGATHTATVTISVEPASPGNQLPTPLDDEYATNQGVSLTIPAPGVLGNDDDPDGDTLTVTGHQAASGGTVTIGADGTLTYTPAADFFGSDSFEYTVDDGNGGTATALVTVLVDGRPQPEPDSYVANQAVALVVNAPGVLGNDADPEGGALNVVDHGPATGGTVAVEANGAFTYTPGAGFFGSDTFEYTVADVNGNIATGQVEIVVNRPPQLNDDFYEVNEGTPLAIAAPGVLGNDADPDGDPLFVIGHEPATGGIVTIDPDGRFAYTPETGFFGTDDVEYTVIDGRGGIATAAVTIFVNARPQPQDDSYEMTQGDSLTVAAPGVLANDGDPDGATLSVVGHEPSVGGGLVIAADGALTYTPASDFFGEDQVLYEVADEHGAAATATVFITVIPTNQPPVAEAGGPYTADEGMPASLDGSASSDPDGDPLTFEWDLDGDGVFGDASGALAESTFADNGEYSVGLRVTDPLGASDTDTAVVTVNNVAPHPAVSAVSVSAQYSDPIPTVAFTATDVPADPLTANAQWGPSGSGLSPGLPAGLSLTGDCAVGALTECSWILGGAIGEPAGIYTVRLAVMDDDGGASSVDVEIAVTPESARTEVVDNPIAVNVDGTDDDADTVTIGIEVTEHTPDDPAERAAPGDISRAIVTATLEPVGPGSPVTGTCTAAPSSGTGYGAVLPVTCDFADVGVNTYSVEVTVGGGFYVGGDDDVLVVADPSLGFITGGGWFIWPGTANPETGYEGDRTNFGFTTKYTRSGRNLRGNLLLIRRVEDGSKYRVKSNALNGLAIGEDPAIPLGWATLLGKSTYIEPGWDEAIGNHRFIMYVEDRGEPGTGADRFWLEIRDKGGAVIDVMSMENDAPTHTVTISGGNMVVPH